jgi:aminoglycoside phosphotransferase (APT) family kinase protein
MSATAVRARPGSAAAFDPTDSERIRSTLADFVRAQTGGPVEIGPLRRFTVGFSWVTFGFRAIVVGGRRAVERNLILRAGPPNGIFGPYRAFPEFTTLGALETAPCRCRSVYWYSDDTSILGAPFFVCDLVPGDAPIPWTHDGGPAFDDERGSTSARQFVAALAALHDFRWQDTPVAGIDGSRDVRPHGRRPGRHWIDLLGAGRRPRADAGTRRAWLRERAPVAARISITHGDYRIGNFLEVDGKITAILDWELVRLGDPVEDLGWVCLQAWRGRSPYMCHSLRARGAARPLRALTGTPRSLADMATGRRSAPTSWRSCTTAPPTASRGAASTTCAWPAWARRSRACCCSSKRRWSARREHSAQRRLIEGIIATMRSDVIPHVADSYARGQAVGVIDLLNNIAPRVEWAQAPLARLVEEKRGAACRDRRAGARRRGAARGRPAADSGRRPAGRQGRSLDAAIGDAIALIWPRRTNPTSPAPRHCSCRAICTTRWRPS